MSKEYYVNRILITFLVLWVTKRLESEEIVLFVRIPAVLYIAYVYLKFHYEMWSYIPQKYARTTPGKAAWFFLIPIFNIYWVFVVYPGFVKDYNAYIKHRKIKVGKIDITFFKRFAVVCATNLGLDILGVTVFLAMLGLRSRMGPSEVYERGYDFITYLYLFTAGATAIVNLITMGLGIAVIGRVCDAANSLPGTPIRKDIFAFEDDVTQE